MKKSIKISAIIVAIAMSNGYAQQQVNSSVSMFPKPSAGQTQYIIDVPHSDKDENKKIEFFVGKMTETDACNNHGLIGELEEKDLEGWGYGYYEFKTEGQIRSTMMGCPDDKKVHRFVSAPGQLVRYNGRLPIVVYVPEGYEVRYKIYTTNDEVFIGKTLGRE